MSEIATYALECFQARNLQMLDRTAAAQDVEVHHGTYVYIFA